MWDETYSEDGFAYGTEPNAFLKETLSSLGLGSSSDAKNVKCLCLAEGEGRNAVYLAETRLRRYRCG